MSKVKCYLTTPVFHEIANHSKVSDSNKKKILELWEKLQQETELKVSDTRFPSKKNITDAIQNWGAQIIGCHLSHPITAEMLNKTDVVAICTSTAGYNHIAQEPGILITHTPGVLHETVADFTIAVIVSNLRNIVELHNFVWNEQWKQGQKWDLDENLSSMIDNRTLAIIGLGEIGKELTKRLYPWGVKILYYDIHRQVEFEKQFPEIQFIPSLEDIFSQADIVSLHVPLMDATHHMVSEKLLSKMKKGALLVNTSRGAVVHFEDLLELLEKQKIEIHLAFDVYEEEPIAKETLTRFKKIAEDNPKFRFIFIPHNASADANTRAQMAIMILEDMISIAESNSGRDLDSLRLIPEQKSFQETETYENLKIQELWKRKKNEKLDL